MKSILITADKHNVYFRTGDNQMIYKEDVNKFEKNTGVTIQDISFPIQGYYINLSEMSERFLCGNFLENLFLEIKKETDNVLIVIDFEDVEELSENFYKSYTKILLNTSNKIISINLNTRLTNDYGNFIKSNIVEVKE